MLSKVISQANIDHVEKWFERAEKIVIVTHVSPDGDAIGSSLGLWHFLESQEKNVNVIVPNAFPDFLRWMPGAKDIIRYDKYKEFADKLIAEADVICCLDFNALSRIDAMADAVAASKGRKMMVDHHLYPGDFCRIVISHPEISSTSELVFRLICRLGYFEDITKEGAECIYTGMMTDTGGFTYNSNNREIYFIISELLDGMQAGVGAVIASVVWDMAAGITKKKEWTSIVIMAAAFIASYVMEVPVVYIVLICIAMGVIRTVLAGRGKRKK